MNNSSFFSVSFTRTLPVLLFLAFISCNSPHPSNGEWKAPDDAHKLKNPLAGSPAALQQGKQLYNSYCATCHGETGFGNGPARGPLGEKPANFHQEKIKSQTPAGRTDLSKEIFNCAVQPPQN